MHLSVSVSVESCFKISIVLFGIFFNIVAVLYIFLVSWKLKRCLKLQNSKLNKMFKLALNLDALCTGLDALKNLVTFKDKLALPLFFSNSRPAVQGLN